MRIKRLQLIAAWAVALPVVAACRNDKQGTEQQASAPPSPRAVRAVRSLPAEAFRVEWTANTVPRVMKAGSSSNVSVTVKNSSQVMWPDPDSTGNQPPEAGAVRLGYRWVPASAGTPASYSPSRADLDAPVQPGQSVTLKLTVTAPQVPGEYRLQLDLVQELVDWFEMKDASRLLIPVRVQ